MISDKDGERGEKKVILTTKVGSDKKIKDVVKINKSGKISSFSSH